MTEKRLPKHSGVMEVLERSKLLPGADIKQLNRLASLVTEVEYKPGETIITERDEAKKLYVIEEGLVAIILELGAGKEYRIQTASNFEVLGWSAIVPPYSYQFTVRAIERTRVLAFNGQELRSLGQNDRDMGYAIYAGIVGVMAERLHNTYLQFIGIT
ncbi:MAG: cyclic nucleotide-binding domain-containing protein [Dehalococcoidales bacterium]|nr:cyclic nucleotide-binding domain-containing protein [Dehalococcoidales bacterium]